MATKTEAEQNFRGDVRMEFKASTLRQAFETARARWCALNEDESAELPWSTTFSVYDDNGGELRVVVDIEFNRVTTLAGASMSGRTTTV